MLAFCLTQPLVMMLFSAVWFCTFIAKWSAAGGESGPERMLGNGFINTKLYFFTCSKWMELSLCAPSTGFTVVRLLAFPVFWFPSASHWLLFSPPIPNFVVFKAASFLSPRCDWWAALWKRKKVFEEVLFEQNRCWLCYCLSVLKGF